MSCSPATTIQCRWLPHAFREEMPIVDDIGVVAQYASLWTTAALMSSHIRTHVVLGGRGEQF